MRGLLALSFFHKNPRHCEPLKTAKQSGGVTRCTGLPRMLCMLAMTVMVFTTAAGAQEAAPGDVCSVAGQFRQSGGPELSGAGHMMVCQGGTWKSILSFNANGQITGASNSTCINGQVLKFDGTKFACAADAGITAETDPTVPANIKDGIAWNEVSGKPVGTLTEGKWCTVSGGDIVCTSDAPSGGGGSIPTCKADMSNIQIGDTCDDGSKFLGSHPNFGWQGFYVTDANQSTSSNWSNSITLCNNLNRHGHTDWYLPSKSELNHLYEYRAVIGGFTTGYYYSSTELDSSYAWAQSFGTGSQRGNSKSTSHGVRCVRRN